MATDIGCKPLSLPQMLGYSLASAGVNMVSAFTNVVLPFYLAGYGVNNVLIGFLAQERSFVGGFVQPVVGAISDRLRTPIGKRKPFFLIGVPLVVASLILLAFHPPLWVVLPLLVVFAFFLAIANDPYLALMADITPLAQRNRVGGLMAAFNFGGQVALLLIAAALYVSAEFWTWLLLCLGIVLTFAITFVSIREPLAARTPRPPAAEPRPRPNPLAYPRQAVGYVREVLRHRELTKYVCCLFLYWFGSGAATPFLSRFAVEALAVDESTAILLVLLAVVSTAVFAVPAGLLGDRFGKKRTMIGGLAFFTLVALVGSQAQNVLQGALVMVLIGIGNAVIMALFLSLLADLAPAARMGEMTGLASMVWSLAQPLGSTLAGLTIDLTGDYRLVFVVAGIMFLASCLSLTLLHPERAAADFPPAQEWPTSELTSA